jgi:hypothetical protein
VEVLTVEKKRWVYDIMHPLLSSNIIMGLFWLNYLYIVCGNNLHTYKYLYLYEW